MAFLEMEQLEEEEEHCHAGIELCRMCGCGSNMKLGQPHGEGSPCGTGRFGHMSQGLPSMLPEDVFPISHGGLPPGPPCPLPPPRVSHCASS